MEITQIFACGCFRKYRIFISIVYGVRFFSEIRTLSIHILLSLLIPPVAVCIHEYSLKVEDNFVRTCPAIFR